MDLAFLNEASSNSLFSVKIFVIILSISRRGRNSFLCKVEPLDANSIGLILNLVKYMLLSLYLDKPFCKMFHKTDLSSFSKK